MNRLQPGARIAKAPALVLGALFGAVIVACGLEAAGTGAAAAGATTAGDDDVTVPEPSGDDSSPSDAAGTPVVPIEDAGSEVDAALTCAVGETACGGGCVQTATALKHCGKCDHACAGTMATCTMGLCAATVHVRAYIDGQSTLEIKRGVARWINSNDSVPGRWDGHDEPTTIDGVAFKPWAAFPVNQELRGRTEPSADMAIPPVAARTPTSPAIATAVQTFGRRMNRVTVIAQPNTNNDFTLKVLFDDSGEGGADFYEGDLHYETE